MMDQLQAQLVTVLVATMATDFSCYLVRLINTFVEKRVGFSW